MWKDLGPLIFQFEKLVKAVHGEQTVNFLLGNYNSQHGQMLVETRETITENRDSVEFHSHLRWSKASLSTIQTSRSSP